MLYHYLNNRIITILKPVGEIPVGQRPESHVRYLTQSMYAQLIELMYAFKAKCTGREVTGI